MRHLLLALLNFFRKPEGTMRRYFKRYRISLGKPKGNFAMIFGGTEFLSETQRNNGNFSGNPKKEHAINYGKRVLSLTLVIGGDWEFGITMCDVQEFFLRLFLCRWCTDGSFLLFFFIILVVGTPRVYRA